MGFSILQRRFLSHLPPVFCNLGWPGNSILSGVLCPRPWLVSLIQIFRVESLTPLSKTRGILDKRLKSGSRLRLRPRPSFAGGPDHTAGSQMYSHRVSPLPCWVQGKSSGTSASRKGGSANHSFGYRGGLGDAKVAPARRTMLGPYLRRILRVDTWNFLSLSYQ